MAITIDQLADIRRRWLAGEVCGEIANGTGLAKADIIRTIRVHFGPAESAAHARAVARRKTPPRGPQSVVFDVSPLDRKSIAARVARHNGRVA